MLTARENARRAVRFECPERLPVLYFNRDIERSDFCLLGPGTAAGFKPDTPGRSEYGYVWVTHDDTMGQPSRPPVDEWDKYYNYKLPDADDPSRYAHIPAQLAANRDKYVIASLGLTGFNQYTFLRGFENALTDLYDEPRRFERLMGEVAEYECGLIRNLLQYDVDCVMFGDDWGTQNALMIDPAMWRRMFLPFYERQFRLAREAGRDVFFHSCGQVTDILEPLAEAGVSCFNLNQPDIFPMEKLAAMLRGKACFLCPVDHQTTAVRGTPAEIDAYARRLRETLGTDEGGYIAYIEEYHSVGMTETQYRAICNSFESMRAQPYVGCARA